MFAMSRRRRLSSPLVLRAMKLNNSRKRFENVALWKAFWIYYLLGTFSLAWIVKFIQTLILHPEIIATYGFPIHPYWYALTASIFLTLYFLWAWTQVWRNAFNTQRKVWGYLARTLTSLHATFSFLLFLRAIFINASLLYRG